MSDNNNNNNNNNNEESISRGNNDNNNANNSNNNRNSNYRSNRNSRSYNNNNSNNDNNKVKGACEELGYNVFDCTSRKQMESCNETLKAIAIYVGKGTEYGKQLDY